MRQRRITPRNPIRTTRQRRAHGASAGTTSMRFGDALLPPLGAAHPHRKNRHHHRIAPTAQYTAIGEKTAEERFHTLARGWLAYPVTPMHAHLPPKSGCINVIPRFALSRRRATALFRNPVCKAQRSVPGFSSTPNSACRRYATSPPIVRHHHLIAQTAQYTAIGEKPPKSGLIC